MSRAPATLGEVFDVLAAEGFVGEGWAAEVLAEADLRAPQPWYVRWMVGFGAWLGSLFLLVSVVVASVVTTGGGFVALGVVFMAAAVIARRWTGNDLTRHAALATSLTGQLLFAGGMAESTGGDLVNVTCGSLIVTNLALIFAFPDRTHRFLSVVFVVASVVALVYAHEAQTLLALLGPALVAAVWLLLRSEGRFVRRGLDELTAPVTAGLLAGALGCLMLSTLYVVPTGLAADFRFYPRPWISTLLLGGLLLTVQRRAWRVMFGEAARVAEPTAWAVTALVVVTALPAPGIVLALLVMSLGLVHGERSYAGVGAFFLAAFTGAYFYGIDVTMMVKSATLVATGAALLLARRLLLALPSADGEARHA